jgi:hypothetical protein
VGRWIAGDRGAMNPFEVWAGPLGPEHDELLPGLRDVAEWGVWLRYPDCPPFDADDLGVLADAFAPLVGHVWHPARNFATAMMERLREHQLAERREAGAFFDWPHLRACLSARATLTTQAAGEEPTEVFGDVSRLAPGALADAARLLSGKTHMGEYAGGIGLGPHFMLAYLPEADAARHWADVCLGLVWLTRCGWGLGVNGTTVYGGGAVRAYLDRTLRLGGVAGLPMVRHSPPPWLTFVGREALVRSAAQSRSLGARRSRRLPRSTTCAARSICRSRLPGSASVRTTLECEARAAPTARCLSR